MRAPLKATALAFSLFAVPAVAAPAIAERWNPEDPSPTTFTHVAVVAIAADAELRHQIENKLVSHLRGRGLMAVASYTIVSDLSAPGDPQQILDRVLEQGIDGVISVRAFPITKQHDEEAWAESWRQGLDEDLALREFVAASLPHSASKAKSYGLDFVVWHGHGNPYHAIWAARTDVYPKSRLRKRSADVLQSVIDAFEEAEIFIAPPRA